MFCVSILRLDYENMVPSQIFSINSDIEVYQHIMSLSLDTLEFIVHTVMRIDEILSSTS